MKRPAVSVGLSVLVLSALIITGCADQPSDPSATPGSPASPAASVPAASSASQSPTPSGDAAISTAAQRYVDAVNAADLDGLVDSFTADGTVIDVSRQVAGADAIRTWADNEVIGGTLRVDAVANLDASTQRIRVHWAPAGSNGWAADYTFTTDGDRITLADLQYAN